MINSANWILIIAGVLAIIGEVLLGAATGFDLALIGIALALGGGLGLVFGSTPVGLITAGALCFIYLAFLRGRVRSKLAVPHRPSNVDALLGKTALVTERIAPHVAGRIKLGDELWRASLRDEGSDAAAIEPGATVVVDSIEGVTLKVR